MRSNQRSSPAKFGRVKSRYRSNTTRNRPAQLRLRRKTEVNGRKVERLRDTNSRRASGRQVLIALAAKNWRRSRAMFAWTTNYANYCFVETIANSFCLVRGAPGNFQENSMSKTRCRKLQVDTWRSQSSPRHSAFGMNITTGVRMMEAPKLRSCFPIFAIMPFDWSISRAYWRTDERYLSKLAARREWIYSISDTSSRITMKSRVRIEILRDHHFLNANIRLMRFSPYSASHVYFVSLNCSSSQWVQDVI